MNCPACHSCETRKFRIIYEAGTNTTISSHEIQDSYDNHTRYYSSSSEQQTSLAKRCSPPNKPERLLGGALNGGGLISLFLVMQLSVFSSEESNEFKLIFFIVFTVLFLFFKPLAKIYEELENKEYEEWQNKNRVKSPINPNNENTYRYKPVENQVIEYLYDLYKEFEAEPEETFFNRKFQNFLSKKNTLNMNEKSKSMTNTALRRLVLFSRKLQSNNNNLVRSRRTSRTSFNNTNTTNTTNSSTSLMSLKNLRNATRRVPKKRLQGKVINPNKQPLTEV